ncbi:MAG: hypothetical protein JWO83_2670 [Caulobacteraceae bacterium]|nr:hypothetical protein [Caulobacteraceae bacterium]
MTAPAPAPPFLRRLITPEGLDLRLTLASAGERASAYLLDLAIMAAALIALTVLAIVLGLAVGEAEREVVAMIWLLGAFLLRNGYFILFELSGRAATPGKRTLGLRVVARDGGRLTAEAIFTRNALREIEVFLPLTFLAASSVAGDPVDGAMVSLALVWSGVFLLFPLFNRDRLRLGDLVAGTWVVRVSPARLLADLAADAAGASPRFAFTADQAGVYGVKELELLEEVLRRRDPQAMAAVADRIRTKIGFAPPPGETHEAFLTAYYAALRGRLEQRLLFGHRRRDKFDKA